MPVSALVDFCSLFGIAGGTVRTALSRMVERGELTTDDGNYQLTGPLLTRQTEQDTGRSRDATAWDGSWYVVIVAAERRPITERRTFRSRAAGAKLGELRADLWMRPANLDIPGDLPGVLVSRGPLLGGDDSEVTRWLWDVDSIDVRSRALATELARFGHLASAGPDGLAPTFVALTHALRHLRTEPQLPDALHSPAAGDTLRSTYRDVEREFRQQLRTYLAGS
jgi:phenylacetic acid degradation operon negative regulatory protein